MNTGAKMKRGEIFTFAAGDIFGGGASIIISFYYLIFLTDVVKLRPALAGIVILVSKIWDAVNDPLMGAITDNTRSKWGRRRPYFLVGFFGILAAFLLLWYPVTTGNEIMRFSYVLFSYLLYSTVSTIVMVPYAAMSSEITQDYEERNTVNGTRLFFSQCASLICAVLPLEIIKLFPNDEKKGYMAMAVAFGALFAIPFLLIFLYTKERVTTNDNRVKFSLKDFIAPFKIRTFRILMAIYLSAFLSMDVVSNVYAYYMNYYLKRPKELNYILGAMLITQIVLVPLIIKLSHFFGKAKILMFSTVVWGIGILFMALLQPSWPSWAVYVNAAVLGMGIVGCVVLPWMMFPDVTDAGELAAGKRNAGSFGGIMTFMRGLSSAVGIFIVSNILDFSGYIKPVDQVVGGSTIKVLMEQPQAVINALKIIVVGFPFILLFVTYVLARKYPLSREVHEKLSKHLEYMRGNIEKPPLSDSEVEQLKKLLI